MKTILIFFNCHSRQLHYMLNLSPTIEQNYKIVHLSSRIITPLTPNQIKLIHDSQFLIVQYLDIGPITHKTILLHRNPHAKFVILPHYKSLIYTYGLLWSNQEQYELNPKPYACAFLNQKLGILLSKKYTPEVKQDFIREFQNTKIGDDQIVQNFVDKALQDFKSMEENSSIKIYDFFKNNYQKQRLYGSSSYPRPIVFYEIVKAILILWNINDLGPLCPYPHNSNLNWYHTICPIPPLIKQEMGLTFDDDLNKLRSESEKDFVNNVYDYFKLN